MCGSSQLCSLEPPDLATCVQQEQNWTVCGSLGFNKTCCTLLAAGVCVCLEEVCLLSSLLVEPA